jgi:hypothetical protein
MTALDALQWYGAGAGVLAALIVASDISRRMTGAGFVLFVTASVALIAWGFLSGDAAGIGWQNVCLLAINAWGVWRYLLRPGGADTSPQSAPE